MSARNATHGPGFAASSVATMPVTATFRRTENPGSSARIAATFSDVSNSS
jgi:hypothetical protein